jgi:hypothetical protein
VCVRARACALSLRVRTCVCVCVRARAPAGVHPSCHAPSHTHLPPPPRQRLLLDDTGALPMQRRPPLSGLVICAYAAAYAAHVRQRMQRMATSLKSYQGAGATPGESCRASACAAEHVAYEAAYEAAYVQRMRQRIMPRVRQQRMRSSCDSVCGSLWHKYNAVIAVSRAYAAHAPGHAEQPF